MLILSRKKDESILIGSDIELKIISIQGDQVKIGIEAPNHFEIFRKEIVEKIKSENMNAVQDTINIQELLKKK